MRLNAPWLALLLPLVPALLWLYARAFRTRRLAIAAFLGEALAPRLTPRWRGRDGWGRAVLLVGAAALLAFALAQPQWRGTGQDLSLRGRDIVVVLDVSLSMLAEDVAPSRLARAKAAVRSLVEALRGEGGHRLALVAFAGQADVRCPLTRDYALFLDRLDVADVDDVPQRGSSLGGALAQALGMIGGLEPAFTDLVLVSDGEDHGGQALEAAGLLRARGFALHAVAVGGPTEGGGAPIPIPIAGPGGRAQPLLHNGEPALSAPRPGLLGAMAASAGGGFVPPDAALSLQGLYREHIAGRPRRERAQAPGEALDHRFQLFVALAVALMAAEMLARDPAGAGA